MKWFKNIETLEELRKQYRKLAMENHPDKGGQVKDMQEINNVYHMTFIDKTNNITNLLNLHQKM